MKEITIKVNGHKYEIQYHRAAKGEIAAKFKYNGEFYRIDRDCLVMRELVKAVK